MASSDEKPTEVRPVRVVRGRSADEVACVEVLAGTKAGTVLPLTTGSTLIGRSSSADLTLEDDGISRKHAKIAISDDDVVNLIDLASTNGTFHNGDRIDVVALKEGDRIQVGPEAVLQFVYRATASLKSNKLSPEDSGLSKRELQVARLVAHGLTSQEVATELKISPRTVTTHLSNVYERLGLPGRAALARYIVEHGLLS
ncbi:MAG: FHA domain-containing protein [Myxococcota bacterium]